MNNQARTAIPDPMEIVSATADGPAQTQWHRRADAWQQASACDDCYILRSNVDQLDRRGIVAGLHPTDRGGGGVATGQDRNGPNVAPTPPNVLLRRKDLRKKPPSNCGRWIRVFTYAAHCCVLPTVDWPKSTF
jgi:hypothetical protein